MMTKITRLALLLIAMLSLGTLSASAERWSTEKANQWYEAQPWLVGCNFAPSTAINQLEMWQADTFDPETIDRELGWASEIGINTVRVFLHDIVWKQDPEGFYKRFDQFLEIADRHGIASMVVFFDGVWDPDPQAGPQRAPRIGVHNSGWVQSPGRYILADYSRQDKLEEYVSSVVKRYAKDKRIVIWDLFNEPDNGNDNSYGPLELKDKDARADRLVRKSFQWARSANPSQPLTVGAWWGGPWDKLAELSLVHQSALKLSDIISFHDYNNRDRLLERIGQLEKYNRPLLCTEFMARGNDSTFEMALPIFKQKKIAAYCWGLVDGKTQTKYPWPTWQMPLLEEPVPWHHEIFQADGTPYRQIEADLIRTLTEKSLSN